MAFAIRDSFEVAKKLGISISRSKICGGGAKSPLWKKILANVLQVELDSVASEQGPGLGGAMLAMVACGAFANVTEACQRLVRVSETVRPDPERPRYEARYQQFPEHLPCLQGSVPQPAGYVKEEKPLEYLICFGPGFPKLRPGHHRL